MKYVLVNDTRGPAWIAGRYVMPADDPHTYESLEDVVAEAGYEAVENGHVLGKTLKIYSLTEIEYTEAVMAEYRRAKEEACDVEG